MEPVNSTQSNSDKKKILVVEDEAYLRDLYKKILTDEGYEVDVASDGEEGYNLMHIGGYDLVLLDIILPKLDGLKILEKLNAEKPQNPNRSIIILSNLGQDSIVAKGLSMGVRGYLVKSDYTPEELVQQVKKYIA